MNKYAAVVGIWIGVGMVGIGMGTAMAMGASSGDAAGGIILTAICGSWATKQLTDRSDK